MLWHDAAGAVSTRAGPHAIADGAAPHLRPQRWSKDRKIAWNFEKLAAALQTWKGRVEFLEDLQNTLQREREKGNIEQHSEERAP